MRRAERRRTAPGRHHGAGLSGLVLAVASAGCGPIEYISSMPLEAAGAVAEARVAKGEKYAPYEMTAAQEYLHKSRELAGYARFHSSVEFARKATVLAKKAHKDAVDKASLPEERPEGGVTPASGGAEDKGAR